MTKIWHPLIWCSLVTAASAAELKPQTIAGWDAYIHGADARMQERLHPGHSFLWLDEAPERARSVREGEIVIAPASEHMPVRVADGLIHDWMGAVFIPGVNLDELSSVLRDYPRYADYYGPHLIDAKLIRGVPAEDEYSLLVVNKALLTKTALAGDYETNYFQVDARRRYSVLRSLTLQEIDDFEQPRQHKLREGEGNGYLWRLHAITRLEQRDGGVYLETEVLGLSRDFPAFTHWMVDSVARRVSKSSLTTSLSQTRAAAALKRAPIVSQAPKPSSEHQPIPDRPHQSRQAQP